MKNRVYDLLKFLIGWPFSLLALFFIVKLIAPKTPAILANLYHLSFSFLFYGMLCFLIYFFIRGYIWKRLVKQTGHEISYKETNFIWASSELKRYIPGNVWSFLGRAVLLTEKGISKNAIALCTLVEIELLILGGAAVCFLAVPFLTKYFALPQYISNISLVLAGILLLFYIFHDKLNIKHFVLPSYPAKEILLLLLLNALMYVFFGVGYYFTFVSFIPLDPNLIWQLTGISILAYLIGYLSLLTPSGFGVREGALFFALAKIMPASTAGFLALLGRFVLTLAEIIYVVLSYIWYQAKNKWLAQAEEFLGSNKHLVILTFLFLVYIIYFSTTSFLRYDNFYAGRFDLGNMAQTVWNTTRGRIFMFTNPNGTEIMSRLSTHADFILVLLAPLYALWPDPRNLLLIQTIILAAGAFFVYFLANEVLKNKNLSLVFAFAYLINPAVQRTNLYDFHAVTLATTFLLAAFYFFIRKKYISFLSFAILAGLCKEEIWLIIGLFGPFLFFWHRKRIFGISLFVVSVSFSYYLISYAIPQALGSQHFALAYYSDFGDSPLKIIKTILLSPQKTFAILLHADRISYLKQLFMPLGYLSLLAPWLLIFAAPDLVIDLLSNNRQLHQIYYQYSATITPFLFIAAIYGVFWIKKLLTNLPKLYNLNPNPFIIVYLLIMALYTAYAFGPLPGAQEPNLDMITKPVADRAFIDTYLLGIRKRYSVAASNNIGSHLSQRQHIYILPLGIDKADIIVFLLNEAEYQQSLTSEKEQVAKLRLDPKYRMTVDRNEFVVFVKK